jgi:hypothetical protein
MDDKRDTHKDVSEDSEDQRIADLIMALDDFKEAALALHKAWEAMDLAGDAMEGCPFQHSFENVTYDIVQWCSSCTAKLSKPPTG